MTETKEEVEKKEQCFKIPEGMKVVGVNYFCTKHGKIDDVMQQLSLTKIGKDGKEHPSITYICPGCLSDLYVHFQKEKLIGDIQIVPQLAPENAKEVEVKEDEKGLKQGLHADNEEIKSE